MEYMQCFTIIYTSDLTVPFATKRVLYLSAASGPDFFGPSQVLFESRSVLQQQIVAQLSHHTERTPDR